MQTKLQRESLPFANDREGVRRYSPSVSRTRPKRYTNWYLRAWMKSLGVRQADLINKTGLNKTAVSLLVNDRQDYSPEIVRDVARALNIAPYELFLHPDDANALKKLMTDAENAADLGKRIRLVPDGAERTGTEG